MSCVADAVTVVQVRGDRSASTFEVDRETTDKVLYIATRALRSVTRLIGRQDINAVLRPGPLANRTSRVLSIALEGDDGTARSPKDERVRTHGGWSLARSEIGERFLVDCRATARAVFSPGNAAHLGIDEAQRSVLPGGPTDALARPARPAISDAPTPGETCVLRLERGLRAVVGFQTRNAPRLGHEFAQRTALTLVDGIAIAA